MIDVFGGITLTALFMVFVAVSIGASPVARAVRLPLAGIALGWFAAIALLGAFGAFAVNRVGSLAIGAAVTAPIVVAVLAVRRSPALRQAVWAMPLSVMIGLHAGRMLGVFFLSLLADDRLSPTFALTAGWGDIAIGALALPLAWAVRHRLSGWRRLALAWNAVGSIDLLAAVTLGLGSAPNSPLRFIAETPGSAAMGSLPWVMIPALLVPLYLLTHVAVFWKLGLEGARFAGRAAPLTGAVHPVPVRARRLY
jgi:hypothetical protein